MDFYFNGSWRMDWGLGNPNKTAVLIACLMIAVWALALFWKRGFWVSLLLFTGLAFCLVQTYSRGGMVSLLSGSAVLLLGLPRPWPKSRWIAVVAALWVLGGFVLYAKAQQRYGQGLFKEDLSISNRLVIWRHVPEMMADAPWGWGMGKAGDVYTQWFQPSAQSSSYLNLINSHFTWMVEWGWLGSILYLSGWSFIFLVCWPVPKSRLGALPLAVWIAFGVGACFSAVAESPWLWIVPLGSLSYSLSVRWKTKQWPSSMAFVMGGLVSMAVVAVFVLIGWNLTSIPLSSSHGMVTIGKGSARTLILVDRKVLGSFYGHSFRKFLATNPGQLAEDTFILTETPINVATSGEDRLVVCGRSTEAGTLSLYPGSRLILVNPFFFPDDAKLPFPSRADHLQIYFGEYTQAPSRSSWTGYAGLKPIQIDGASDFIPTWPQAILGPNKS